MELRAREELEALADTLPSELNGGVRVETGVPWESILRAIPFVPKKSFSEETKERYESF